MKFLIEKTLNEVDLFSGSFSNKKAISKKPFDVKFNTESDIENFKNHVSDYIESNPNLENNKKLYNHILFNDKGLLNKAYMNYIGNMKTPVKDENTILGIYNAIKSGNINGNEEWFKRAVLTGPQSLYTTVSLVNNGSLTGEEKWLKRNSLWTESDGDIAFKIKAFTYVQKQENTDGYNGLDVDSFFYKQKGKKKEVITAKYLRNKLYNFQKNYDQSDDAKEAEKERRREEKEIAQKGDTGFNILTKSLKVKKLNKDLLHDYMKGIIKDTGTMKTLVSQVIDSGAVDKELNKILEDRYKSYIGEEPIEMLNDRLLDAIKKVADDSIAGK